MHSKEQIGTVVNSVNEEFNQCLNQLPLNEEMMTVSSKLTSLFSQLIGVIKTVIQERNIE